MISQCILLAFILFLLPLFLLQFFFSKRNNKPKPPSPPSIPKIGHLHLLKPLIHQAFQDLSNQYGPLISLKLGSIPFVITSTPSLAKEFLKTNELTFSSRKMNIAINTVVYDNATFAFAPYGRYWKFIKKLSTTQLFGNRIIGQFLPIRTNEVHAFIKRLVDKSKSEESVNLTQALLKLSNNIISRMMLSIESSGTDSQAEQARALVREVTQIFGEFNVSDFVGFCKGLDLQGLKQRAMEIHKRYDGLLEKIISDREESRRKCIKMEGCDEKDGEVRVKDFLDILLDVSEEKDCEINFTRNHIKSLILDYFTAATDTTAISIEWAIAELFNNPKVLKKAQEEVDKVTGKERLVCESDSPNLPYIHAIIKVSNCGPQQVLRPQYCCCGSRRNGIGPQLRCDLQSPVFPQRNRNVTASQPQWNRNRPQRLCFNHISFKQYFYSSSLMLISCCACACGVVLCHCGVWVVME